LSWASGGSAVDLQPALAADRGSIHLLYYKVTPGPRINVILADSSTGASFTRHRVNSVTFPGVPNLPQFDPIIAPAYMGDYLWITACGGLLYTAWGDKRNTVTNFLWPTGRTRPRRLLCG
jgi:hypothetical protein